MFNLPSQYLCGGTEENHWKLQSRYLYLGEKFQLDYGANALTSKTVP
jgi:hypothetical protein